LHIKIIEMIDTRVPLSDLNDRNKNALMANMGIEFTEIGPEYLMARMPVDNRTRQPMGLLHGGASAALAETVGSTAAYLSVDRSKYYTVGLEIKCNHVRGISSGFVNGVARAVHIGKKTHVWLIEIKDETGNLICLSTLTMAVLELDEAMKEKHKDLYFKV
jgi:1,4-dihydroxy-2-naphthoyl-CoA hydrolase